AAQKLAELQARRVQLIAMITMEKNRLDKSSLPMQKHIRQIVKTLEKQLQDIDKEIANIIQNDAAYAQKSALLQTVKGIGAVSSANLIANLPELGALSAKEIAALAGVAPYNCDSGTLKGRRTIWGGRASVRCGLYMATLVAIRHNPT